MLSARFGEGLVDKYFVLLVMLTIVDLLDQDLIHLACIFDIHHFAFTALARLIFCMH